MRAVVFDMDGLMFNTEDVYFQVGDTVLQRRGHRFSRALSDAMMGRQPRPAFEAMIAWHQLSDTWEQLKAESEKVFLALLDDHLAAMPGLLELLADLEKAGVPKAIGTSSARRLVDACLARLNLQGRFAFILSAEDIVHSKPDPEIYLTAARRFHVPAGAMAVLEDSATGCRAAAAAGAYTVAVPGNHSRQQDFSVAQLVADSLADPRLYQALGLR